MMFMFKIVVVFPVMAQIVSAEVVYSFGAIFGAACDTPKNLSAACRNGSICCGQEDYHLLVFCIKEDTSVQVNTTCGGGSRASYSPVDASYCGGLLSGSTLVPYLQNGGPKSNFFPSDTNYTQFAYVSTKCPGFNGTSNNSGRTSWPILSSMLLTVVSIVALLAVQV
ncbi:hypothetical protein MIR68_011118 [Amoeboaphelidium protococcarum]|nr:hypothetical protein MIR68_011118 [Amoeboaphelidium protococcarum]